MTYVQSVNKIYTQTAFDYNHQHVLLLTLNASDGTYASSPYIWNSSWDTSELILNNEDNLYIMISCNSISILSVLHISSETFTNYEFESSINIKATSINSVTSSLILVGSLSDNNKTMYYSSAFTSSLSDHPDISVSSISVISTSDYASVDGSFTLTDMGNFTFTSISPTYSSINITEDASQSYTSDVVYYFDAASTITVNTLTSFESTVSTLWSTSGNTSISYNLVANGNDTLPTWVSFNESSFQLSGTSPELNVTTAYTLNLESNTSGSDSVYQTTITINVTYEWEVSNWYYCYTGEPNSCKTCADGYIHYDNEQTWTIDEVSEEVESVVVATQSAIILTASTSVVS